MRCKLDSCIGHNTSHGSRVATPQTEQPLPLVTLPCKEEGMTSWELLFGSLQRDKARNVVCVITPCMLGIKWAYKWISVLVYYLYFFPVLPCTHTNLKVYFSPVQGSNSSFGHSPCHGPCQEGNEDPPGVETLLQHNMRSLKPLVKSHLPIKDLYETQVVVIYSIAYSTAILLQCYRLPHLFFSLNIFLEVGGAGAWVLSVLLRLRFPVWDGFEGRGFWWAVTGFPSLPRSMWKTEVQTSQTDFINSPKISTYFDYYWSCFLQGEGWFPLFHSIIPLYFFFPCPYNALYTKPTHVCVADLLFGKC